MSLASEHSVFQIGEYSFSHDYWATSKLKSETQQLLDLIFVYLLLTPDIFICAFANSLGDTIPAYSKNTPFRTRSHVVLSNANRDNFLLARHL